MPGPGARHLVVAPQRRAPTLSLLTAAEMVVEDPTLSDPTNPNGGMDRNADRWMNGVTYRRERCAVAEGEPVGCTTSLAEESPSESENADRSVVASDPFMVVVEEQCSTLGWSENEYVPRARRLLEATEAYAVEKEFWTGTQAKAGTSAGVDYPHDQWLAQSVSCTVLNGGSSTDMPNGLGLLQQAIGDTSGGSPGMIHMPPPAFNGMLSAQLVTPVGTTVPSQVIDGRGNRIVPGFGYSVNTGPTGAAAGAGFYWLYATGMVYVRRSDTVVTPDTYSQALVRSGGDIMNSLAFRAMRYYVVDWDRCVHFACLVQACSVCK